MPRLHFFLAVLCLTSFPAAAQLSDDFSDGDFILNPTWTGAVAQWTIADLDGDPALRSKGLAEADTIYLVTPSTVSRGTWRLRFDWHGVNLSNFNGARVFLMADRADLTGMVQGYFVQLGTNNSDEVRLYRQDGDPTSSNRVLLGASEQPLLAGDDGRVEVEVSRSEAGLWTVSVNGSDVLTAEDATYMQSAFFGVWVKHAATAAQSYFFDDFTVYGDSGPADTTPPTVVEAAFFPLVPGFSVRFSEPITSLSVERTDFSIAGIGAPDSLSVGTAIVTLFVQPPAAGDYAIAVSGITDLAGNVLADTTVTVFAEPDLDPPQLTGLLASTNEGVEVIFNEEIVDSSRPDGLDDCTEERYELRNERGESLDFDVLCTADALGSSSVFLETAQPLENGMTYTVTVRSITDLVGNVLDEASASFTFFDGSDEPPKPGEIVINEIMYDGSETALEYVELLNLTDRTFGLGGFRLADSRFQPVDVPHGGALPPNGYAVLVRDAAAFTAAFPGGVFVEVPGWPALNDTGDAAILLFGETVIDSVAFEPRWGGNGLSLERIDPVGPSNAAANWGSTTDPRGGTPNAQNTIFEIDQTPPQLVSATPSTDSATLTVVFDEPLDPASVTSGAFSLAPATSAITDTDLEGATVLLSLDPPLAPGTYTLTVRGVRDAKGNTLDEASVAFSIVRVGTPSPRDVVINEILYDPEDTSEYVELLNRSDATFDLSQFGFADDRGQPVPIGAAPRPLAPGAFAVLVQDGAAFALTFPGVDFVEMASWPALNNGGDVPTLFFGETIIDAAPYQPGWGGDGVALERVDPAGSSTSRFNFGDSVDSRGGTPGTTNSIFAPDLMPPAPLFAEQTADNEIELFLDEPLDPISVDPDAFALDDGRTPRLTFLLGENERVLLQFDGAVSGPLLAVTGLRDLVGNALDEAAVAIAYQPAPGEVLLNEILFDPLASATDGLPDQPEYLEFLNTSSRTTTLRGAYWTDQPDEDGEADTLRLGDGFFALPPGGYAVAFANGEADAGTTTLETAFPDAAGLLVPLNRTTLGFVNSGDLVRLHRVDATVLDEVFYEPDWHNPSFRDATGISLERILPTGPSNDGTNWTSSTHPSGGTPGRANSVLLPPDDMPRMTPGIDSTPTPFSPDGDGIDDQTVIRFSLANPASLIRVRIFDVRGRFVRTLEAARLAGRTGELIWDGLDDEGRRLRVGPYVILLEALGAEGGTTEVFKEVVVLAKTWE